MKDFEIEEYEKLNYLDYSYGKSFGIPNFENRVKVIE